MLFFDLQVADNTRLAIWKIEETEEQLLSCFRQLKEEYAQEIHTYKSESRRLEYLAVRRLLLQMTGAENRVLHDANGKPSLLDKSLNISISHTKGYASVILSSQHMVGVDIEVKRDKIFRVKHKYLSESELNNIDTKNELESLLLHWCAKETIFKMASQPLPDFAEEIAVEPFLVSPNSGVFSAQETKSQQAYCLHYQIFDDFVMTYAMV